MEPLNRKHGWRTQKECRVKTRHGLSGKRVNQETNQPKSNDRHSGKNKGGGEKKKSKVNKRVKTTMEYATEQTEEPGVSTRDRRWKRRRKEKEEQEESSGRRVYGVSCHISAARKPRVQRDATRRDYREECSTETRSQCGREQGQNTGTQRRRCGEGKLQNI